MHTPEMVVSRSKSLDFIRGFAIFFVVIAHAVQYSQGVDLSKTGVLFDNALYAFIVSFNMPQFMLIAGYLFFFSSEKHNTKVLVISKLKLLIPIFVWGTLEELFQVFTHDHAFSVYLFFNNFLTTLWFLWAVVFCSLGVIVGKKLFKDNIIFHIIVLAILVITPDLLHKALYGFMYPYFVAGYYFNKHRDRIHDFINSYKTILLVTALYVILMFFWNRYSSIYMSGFSLYKSENIGMALYNNFYRWVVGFSGAFAINLLLNKLYQAIKSTNFTKIAVHLGKQSLGIYILDGYISIYLLQKLPIFASWNTLQYSLICIPIAFIVATGISVIISLIQNSRLLNMILFAGK